MTEFEAELKARKFVQEAGVDTAPVDLSRYLERVSGKVTVDELDPDEAGYTMQTAKGPLITLNALDREVRRRFTQCHEIAHVVLELPSEHSHGPEWSYAKRPLNEVCCDVFAAELLLPYKLFLPAAKNRQIDFDTVDSLRVDFFASREAVASRLAATSKLPCGYLLSEAGEVQHFVRSPSFRNAYARIERGTRLPERSAAHLLRSGQGEIGSLTHSGDVWLDGWKDVQLVESSVYLPTYDQTLTLLFCDDQDEVDALVGARPDRSYDRESDELLSPLDGQLKWPSKSRRR